MSFAKEEMEAADWPQGMLLGCIVTNFNPVGHREYEDHAVDGDHLRYTFMIKWDHWAPAIVGDAVDKINEVIAAGAAEFTPTNKDGFIVSHEANHIVAYFQMDECWYIQHGHVAAVWKRLRRFDESRIPRHGTEPVKV